MSATIAIAIGSPDGVAFAATPVPVASATPAGTVASAAPAASASPTATPAPHVLPLSATVLPDAKTIRSAVDQGEGPDLTRSTLVAQTTSNGVVSLETTYEDGKFSRTIFQNGKIHEEYGFAAIPGDGPSAAPTATAWHMNANGEVVLDEADPGKAAPDAYAEHVERAPAPSDALVLVKTNGHGTTLRTTVARTTGHILRFDETTPAQTSSTTYSDFRTVNGSTQAWAWSYRDGHAENAEDYRITRLDAGPVAPADLALPAGRVFVEFPKGSVSEKLPVRLDRGKFIVRVTIAGRGVDLVLDTGCAGITLDDDIVRELGLPILDRSSNPANSGRVESTTAIVPEMDVGALVMHDVVIDTIPHMGDDEPGTYKTVGLLGFDFIADTKLVLDYQHETVTAYDRDIDVGGPPGKHAYDIPVRLGTQTPETDLRINGDLGERFTIDTGAGAAMLVFDYFARRHPKALTGYASYEYQDRQYYGVGGEFDTKPYQIHSVVLGDLNFADFTIYAVTQASSYSSNEDGLVGSDFLDLFTVYLDYPESDITLYLNDKGASATK